MTKFLELPEDMQADLRRAAERDQISEEDLALRVLRDYLARASVDETSENIADKDWKEISQSVIEDNRELLLRLAK
jgi:hypothetical protein